MTVAVDEILASKGFLTVDPTGSLSTMRSFDDMDGFTGICRRGPWEGYTLSHDKPLVQMHKGAYRHLDGRWWWTPLA